MKEEMARLSGLRDEHALHPISTGKLEGFNDRIKVAKKIGYGYRSKGSFFSLILYISIPSNRHQSHKKTCRASFLQSYDRKLSEPVRFSGKVDEKACSQLVREEKMVDRASRSTVA